MLSFHSVGSAPSIKFNNQNHDISTNPIKSDQILQFLFIIRSEMLFFSVLALLITQQIVRMKEESVDAVLPEAIDVPTVAYREVMTEEFVSAYHEALKFSNLQFDRELKYRNVNIYDTEHMHQLYTVGDSSHPHIVLLHGYGGSSLTFIRTFEHLKNHFQIHALDTFGVGLSSRGKWQEKMTPEQTGIYYIDAIEEWRKTVGIKEFILAGHSFGGYIGSLYLEKYPERVKQIIFLSAAGSGKISAQTIAERARNSKLFFCLGEKIFNCGIRPSKVMDTFWIGNKFINRVLTGRLKLVDEQKQAWQSYFKHICKIDQSSQGGFYNLFGWPLQPIRSIEEIIRQVRPKVKIDFFYGDTDWMANEGAKRLAKDFQNVDFHVIENSGHQLIFDNPIDVTRKIKEVTARD